MTKHDAPAQWSKRGPHAYLEGRSHIDGVDALAHEMERKWGVDRLRLLVPANIRLKFDTQRQKLNNAIWHGDLPDLDRECGRMIAAWRYCDRVATEAGHAVLSPEAWETSLSDGTAITIVRDGVDAHAVADGRRRQVWSLDEVARVIEAFPDVVKAKTTFPGAAVVRTGFPMDPLAADVGDDVIPFGD